MLFIDYTSNTKVSLFQKIKEISEAFQLLPHFILILLLPSVIGTFIVCQLHSYTIKFQSLHSISYSILLTTYATFLKNFFNSFHYSSAYYLGLFSFFYPIQIFKLFYITLLQLFHQAPSAFTFLYYIQIDNNQLYYIIFQNPLCPLLTKQYHSYFFLAFTILDSRPHNINMDNMPFQHLNFGINGHETVDLDI